MTVLRHMFLGTSIGVSKVFDVAGVCTVEDTLGRQVEMDGDSPVGAA